VSEEQDNTKPKRGRGRPKGSKSNPPQRNVAFTMSMAEAVREGVDPRYIVKFHKYIIAGINPVYKLDKHDNVIDVIPDPSPMAQSPDLARKSESAKFLTAYGWGQPAQSVQIDAEFRAKIDQLGSGIPTQELMTVDLSTLFKLAEALKVPMLTDVTDAEIIDDPLSENKDTVTVVSDTTNTNSPLPGNGSEPIS
jgi:hypothetical protein